MIPHPNTMNTLTRGTRTLYSVASRHLSTSSRRTAEQAKQGSGNSSSSSSSGQGNGHWSSSFDKTMLYPGVLIILLGSQLINVMNAQKSLQDLERRYELKIGKINEIVARLERGESGVNVDDELKLVNMMFERQSHGGKLKLGREYEVSDSVSEPSTHEELLKEEDFMKLLGLHEDIDENGNLKKNKKEGGDKARAMIDGSKVVITDQEEIREQTDMQKKLVGFKVEPERHLIVEKPGDYIDAAKDTKLSKFL